jgi:hypothetical protein
MRHLPHLTAYDWVKRINRSWIVRHQLNDHADAWLAYLAESDAGRLEASCLMAQKMCDRRMKTDDPKPWFYAGLFHLATVDEARRFLDLHRVTKATVPAMAADESVCLWLDRVSPETRELLARLRQALLQVE